MHLLKSFINKQLNIYFPKTSSLYSLRNVTLKEVDTHFFRIEGSKKFYSISLIEYFEEYQEPEYPEDLDWCDFY